MSERAILRSIQASWMGTMLKSQCPLAHHLRVHPGELDGAHHTQNAQLQKSASEGFQTRFTLVSNAGQIDQRHPSLALRVNMPSASHQAFTAEAGNFERVLVAAAGKAHHDDL